jgi:hypothetical protein
VTQRIEPVGPRRDLAPAERVALLTPVERELERERREQRRRERPRKPAHARPEADSGGSLDVRA